MIRSEADDDREAVFDVHRRAFETDAEARLVDALRGQVSPAISLVATVEQRVVGHVLLSMATVDGAAGTAMGLAPLAVLPDWQGQGIGGELVVAGLQACREIERPVVFVLGEPRYYGRFGFQPAPVLGLRYGGPECDPYFMVAELRSRALRGLRGEVRYHRLFDEV